MNRRINIMLPESTLAVLDQVTSRGNRSRFISRAVLHYVENRGKRILREQLKAGYQANTEDSVKIAVEWFPLEEEAWQSERSADRRFCGLRLLLGVALSKLKTHLKKNCGPQERGSALPSHTAKRFP
jgi:hypothetical protein